MKTVSIIGAGRLGTALGSALANKGYSIQGVSCLTLDEARESSHIIQAGRPFKDNIKAAGTSRFIILTVPDDSIPVVAEELAAGIPDWKNKLVWHCSGILASSVLAQLKARTALTASVHPIYSFAEKAANPEIFSRVYFSIEGDDAVFGPARDIVQDLGGLPFRIQAEDKPLYHAACSIASNFLIVLIESAAYLLSKTKGSSNLEPEILFPLIQGTLQNVNKLDVLSALTGPIKRGDEKTIAAHLKALQKFPQHQKLYRRLAGRTLEMVKLEGKLEQRKRDTLTKHLEEK